MMKWIDVEKMLPKERERVLMYHAGLNDIDMGSLSYMDEDKPIFAYYGGHPTRGITHWMPLPLSPKDDDLVPRNSLINIVAHHEFDSPRDKEWITHILKSIPKG